MRVSFIHRIVAPIAVLALAAGCSGSDSDGGGAGATTASNGTESTTETSVPTSEPTVPDSPAQATFMTDDTTIAGTVTSCSSDSETQVEMTVEGENAGFEVASADNNQVFVSVSGAFEFEGIGDATVSDLGSVQIVGTGSEPDDSAPVQSFTVVAQLETC